MMKNRLANQVLFALVGALLVFVGLYLGRLSTPVAAQTDLPIATRSDEEQRTITAYKAVSEAVVFITTTTILEDPFEELFVGGRPREGTGSGIVVDADRGIIVTNLHVLSDAKKIEVTLADGRTYKARVLGFDREYDLAVIQIANPPEGLPRIQYGDSAKLEVGQKVLAIGNPFRLSRTLTTGIISGLDRVIRNPGSPVMKGLIQTDAAINPGNSGGPLLDADGRLIGINTAILSQSGDSAGIGFAVPINQIKRVLPELIATGKVLRPALGWILVDTNQGTFVRRVAEGGPADKSGVQPVERRVENVFLQGYVVDFTRGDLIVAVNGERVKSREDVEQFIADSGGNKEIAFTLRRGGARGPERVVKIRPALQ